MDVVSVVCYQIEVSATG